MLPGVPTPEWWLKSPAGSPDPNSFAEAAQREAATRALTYMGLEPDTLLQEVKIDRVFIGACTNSRLEDLRAAAAVVQGRRVNPEVYAMVVPGSALVKQQAEAEGLDAIFKDAGFDWAGGRLLDVPGDEPGHLGTGPALRLDLQPQL